MSETKRVSKETAAGNPPPVVDGQDRATETEESRNLTHEEISARAYQLWQDRGAGHGGHEDDWYRAEQELRAEKKQPSSSERAAASAA